MLVLLDECLPRKLKASLNGHVVRTVPEMGWAGTKDAALIRLASSRFDALLTVDQGFPTTVSPSATKLIFVLLRAPTNRLADLQPLTAEILRRLSGAEAGDIIRIPTADV